MWKDKEKCLAWARAYKKRNRERIRVQSRRRHLEREYGISPEVYAKMLAEQEGRCFVCRTDEHKCRYGKLYVDHNHTTGAVRRLLCNRCNVALGMVDDSPGRLRQLAEYLEQHN